MKMFRAIGLGIAILVIQGFAPQVWDSLQQTLVSLFSTVQLTMSEAAAVIGSINVPH